MAAQPQVLLLVPVSPWCGAGEGGAADCRGGEVDTEGTLSTVLGWPTDER